MKKTFEQPEVQVQTLVSDEILFSLSSLFSIFDNEGGEAIID